MTSSHPLKAPPDSLFHVINTVIEKKMNDVDDANEAIRRTEELAKTNVSSTDYVVYPMTHALLNLRRAIVALKVNCNVITRNARGTNVIGVSVDWKSHLQQSGIAKHPLLVFIKK